jgi:hypothetical protein
MRNLALVLPLLAASCAFAVPDPVTGDTMAKCYDGAMASFCVADTPPGTSIVQGQGIFGALMYGFQGMLGISLAR